MGGEVDPARTLAGPLPRSQVWGGSGRRLHAASSWGWAAVPGNRSNGLAFWVIGLGIGSSRSKHRVYATGIASTPWGFLGRFTEALTSLRAQRPQDGSKDRTSRRCGSQAILHNGPEPSLREAFLQPTACIPSFRRRGLLLQGSSCRSLLSTVETGVRIVRAT